ncbi:MAG: hypothetical protein HS108_02090 [Planctomycetes bacterium]|jgi:type VI secretion system protein ImpI|nr:hypothetical protein [Planctomycetota bacterium]MCL4730377.1 hypothetical protein [Planctomycetota bacterium]
MALKLTVTKADSGAPVAEQVFGKEARARGINLGSDPSSDLVLPGAAPKQARIERRPNGYFLVDLAAGNAISITDGTQAKIGDYLLRVGRAETPRRDEAAPAAVIDASAPQGSVTAATHRAMSELSRYFLGEGAFMSEAEVRRFADLLKLTLEVAMEWMGKALRGREEFKDQFSAPLTQLFARSLNPVKKGQDLADIASFLLDWREDRDIETVRQSLQHAFHDMARHQVGLLAGVQQFVTDLQTKLDPQKIAQDAGGGLLGGGAKKAWARYEQLYGETFVESSKLFNELIYPSIRKGYIFSHDDVPDRK